MSYSSTLYDSITAVPAEDWQRLRQGAGNPLTDPRYILALERSLGDQVVFRYLLVRDGSGAAVAGASMYHSPIDLAALAGGWVARCVGAIRRILPGALRPRVAWCGLPVTADSGLRLLPGADVGAVLKIVDRTLTELAAEGRAPCVVWRGLTAPEVEQLAPLDGLDYQLVPAAPMNYGNPVFHSFEEFCGSVRPKRRVNIHRSQRRFAASGLRVVHLTGCAAAGLFTDDVYRLYEAVHQHAARRLEKVPAAFFRQAIALLPEHVGLTLIYDGEHVVAFSFQLFTDAMFRSLFVGFDYQRNRDCHLYFNLMFHAMDRAYRHGVAEILGGLTSDAVKSEKLGCRQEPRYIYIKGTRPLVSRFIRRRLPKYLSRSVAAAGPAEDPS